jgi:hypothetical protein
MQQMPDNLEKTQRKRSVLVILILFVLALVVPFTLIALFDQPGRFSRNNYLRIHDGMTLAQVEALLGAPGEELRRATLFASPDRRERPLAGDQVFRWHTPGNPNGSCVLVGLKDGKVCDKRFYPNGL